MVVGENVLCLIENLYGSVMVLVFVVMCKEDHCHTGLLAITNPLHLEEILRTTDKNLHTGVPIRG